MAKAAAKNTSIALGEHYATFVGKMVADGRYGSASEVVRASLRLLEEREAKLSALRAALSEGEDSGHVQDYSIDAVIDELDRE